MLPAHLLNEIDAYVDEIIATQNRPVPDDVLSLFRGMATKVVDARKAAAVGVDASVAA
ncbi:hypothetical protein [Rhodococcus ruber]|uniref:hypothetical protein n=1 Tax=Rhodococcus ruber TaxID=1830 RepID=UPI003782FF60